MVVKFRQKKSRLFTVIFYIHLSMLNSSKNNELKRTLRFFKPFLAHIGKTFYCFRKALDGLICITMFNAIADTMFDMAFQHYFSAAVEGRFGSVDLGEHILAGNVLVNHTVNGLYLADYFF